MKEKKKDKSSFFQKHRIFKFILLSLCSLLVLLAAAVGVVLLFPGTISELVVTKAVSRILGVKITVEDIAVYPIRGRLELRKLTIYNPEGKNYKSDYAIHLGYINAEIAPLSLISGKKTIIREITLKDITINYESELLLNSNLQDIMSNLDKLQDKQKKDRAENPNDSGPDRGLELDLFEMENVRLNIEEKGFSQKAGIPVTIHPLGPFGDDKDEGISPVELSLYIFSTILLNASQQAGIKISDTAMETINAIRLPRDVRIKRAVLEVHKDTVQEGKKIVNSVKGLF